MNKPTHSSSKPSTADSTKALQDFLSGDDELQSLRGLKTALQGLPLKAVPETAGWEQISQQLNHDTLAGPASIRKRKASHGWLRADEWIGIAAALLVVISVVFYRPPLSISPQPVQVVEQGGEHLRQLVERSQFLENTLRALRQQDNGQVLSGYQAVTTDELERMIAFVDLQIAASEVSRNSVGDNELISNERTGLWQQRVALLSELLINQYAGRYGGLRASSDTELDTDTTSLLNQQI